MPCQKYKQIYFQPSWQPQQKLNIKFSFTCQLSLFKSPCMNSIYSIKHVYVYKIVTSKVFFFSETIPHMLNFNRKQWLKAMLFHNPEVHCFHLKLLSLWKFTRLSGSACLITRPYIIIVESGGILIHNYTIIAIFEVNMMIYLPKEYNIYRAEGKINIVFRS